MEGLTTRSNIWRHSPVRVSL